MAGKIQTAAVFDVFENLLGLVILKLRYIAQRQNARIF